MAKNNVDRVPGSLAQEMDWAMSNKGGDGVFVYTRFWYHGPD